MLLTSMPDPKQANTVKNSKTNGVRQKNQPFLKNMNIPSGLNDIQPRSTQVCNCGEIVFDTNGRWNKIICTYKFIPGKLMWKVQTGERAKFWCTLLVFTRSN